jgi:hypothetical protein
MTGESDSSLMDTMFFNEHDAFAATWLRNLWPNATVDERCIREVREIREALDFGKTAEQHLAH